MVFGQCSVVDIVYVTLCRRHGDPVLTNEALGELGMLNTQCCSIKGKDASSEGVDVANSLVTFAMCG